MKETLIVARMPGSFDIGATRTITLRPGLNTGAPGRPCPECKTQTRRHEAHCRHFLYQRQWEDDR